jgi:hypothetical protein
MRAMHSQGSRADVVAEKLGSFVILAMRVRSGMSSPAEF